MATSPSSNLARQAAAVASWIHGNFLWLLVASYLLAALLPGPGLAIRNLSLTPPAGDKVTVPLLLLALLLFCAATVVRWSQVRYLLQRPGILLLSLVAIWIVPSLMVSLLGWVLPQMLGEYVTTGMMVGLALVAAMPVANSSVAWTQNAQGNVALSLGLIVLSIVLSPLATPQMLNLMGLSLSDQETSQCEQLVTKFSGGFFIVWVILPSLAGGIANRLAGTERIERARGAIRLVSALTLLTLNYTNASLAMPKVFDNEGPKTVLISATLAVLLSVLGMASGWLLSRWMSLSDESRVSLIFGFSMKHTGLALVLAGEVLDTEPRVILMIVLATLLQHIIAGVADWFLMRLREKETDR
ncbi:MAG: bile acid:sodium symporter [Planctomycetales bacterium]|nr:bile acid:sodium symporter [Planctomycetales bacterium]